MIRTLFSLALVFLSLQSSAEQLRYYIGGIIGPGINYFKNDKNYVHIRHPAHASFAWNIFAGINLFPKLSLELGYLNLGFYENSGNGESICDIHGKCGYQKKSIDHFDTKLTVVNDIEVQYYYLDLVPWLYKSKHLQIFAKFGLAYTNASLDSYVDVFPKVFDYQFEIKQTVHSKSQNALSPQVALGYEYRASKNIYIRSEIDYMFPTRMLAESTQQNEGVLYPISLLFGTRVTF